MSRSENANITRTLIIGSHSKRLNNTDPEAATHAWTCYVRSPFNTPMNYIQNVTFKLHETFKTPVIVKEYPFEINNEGWGEFTIHIKINFVDPNERSLNTTHYLVLHEGEEVVNEKYEEIVFKSPTKNMLKILNGQEVKTKEFIEGENEEEKLIDNAILKMVEKFENEF
ncbi:YEATS domain-containing protein 4 [Binucleata daphniae]